MSVAQKLLSNDKTAFSFEVLPPLRGNGIEQLFDTIDTLMPFNPAYINITTHRTEVVYREQADGTFVRQKEHKRPGSVAIASAIRARYNIPTVPHIICSGFSATELENELIDLSYLGITDLLVLRGDKARVDRCFVAEEGGYDHAEQLCRQVTEFNAGRLIDGTCCNYARERFSFGVAGYPEKHEEAMNLSTDIEFLRRKVEAGAEYVVTQMFFDNEKFFDFVARVREAGITVPIIPGLKPLTSLTQQTLLPTTFHIDFPDALANEFRRCRSNDDVKALGVEWSIAQARELKAAGVPSIHFYSMNATRSIEQIARSVY